jgi:hypothetical protein
MNRHQRRAAKAQVRSAKLSRVTAIHEAGHAVARVLTASDFGIAEADAVDHIRIGEADPYGQSRDGSAQLFSGAVTMGPMLSAQLQSLFKMTTEDVPRDQICTNHVIEAVRLAQSQGVDISDWLRASMLIAASGAAAEARHTGRDIRAILNGYQGESDLNSAKNTGAYAGLSASQIDDFIAEAIVRAKGLISQPDVWVAVTSVADAMPNHGRMSGEKVAALVQAACPIDKR